MRLSLLWAAYALMVGGFALSTYRLDARMSSIEDDICFAVVTDLGVDLLNPNLTDESRDLIAGLIEEIRQGCKS